MCFPDDWAIFSVMQQKMLQVTHFKAHYSQNTVSDGLSDSPPVKACQFEGSLLPWPVRTTKGQGAAKSGRRHEGACRDMAERNDAADAGDVSDAGGGAVAG
ncbi:hypothetical protein AUQ42_08815 [Thalassospira sp. MCCC 1A02491]|nr:hypothetical protein AUQ42_08815 [Thalassospira sp. MCCC 1A02491]